MLGLLSELPGKNCWTIAEYVGDATPDGVRHLLARAVWDADEVGDDLRDQVCDHLGEHNAVLFVDETGDLKKGTHTVGVQRQYTGTAGRVENSQVAVDLSDATTAGHALIDRALYVPKSWTGDHDPSPESPTSTTSASSAAPIPNPTNNKINYETALGLCFHVRAIGTARRGGNETIHRCGCSVSGRWARPSVVAEDSTDLPNTLIRARAA